MKFSEFLALNEDGEGGGEGSAELSSPVNTTANIEGYSLPIGISLFQLILFKLFQHFQTATAHQCIKLFH